MESKIKPRLKKLVNTVQIVLCKLAQVNFMETKNLDLINIHNKHYRPTDTSTQKLDGH